MFIYLIESPDKDKFTAVPVQYNEAHVRKKNNRLKLVSRSTPQPGCSWKGSNYFLIVVSPAGQQAEA